MSAAVECHLRTPSIAVADDAEADRLVDELEVWLTGQQSQAEIADVSRTEWNELGTLLGGTGLHDVEAAFEALEAAHQAAADSVSNCGAHVDRLSGEFDLIVLPAELPSSTPLERSRWDCFSTRSHSITSRPMASARKVIHAGRRQRLRRGG